jgi:hypothetical protein
MLRSAALLTITLSAAPAFAAAVDSTSQVAVLAAEAKAVAPLYRSKLVADFLGAVKTLPRVEPRTIYCDSSRTHCWTEAEAAALPDTQRARLVVRKLDESFYYTTRYGSPLAMRDRSKFSRKPAYATCVKTHR